MRICLACAMALATTQVLAAETIDRRRSLHQPSPTMDRPTSTVPVGKANRIVVYSASWCFPCQQLKPVIGSLKKEGYKVVYRDIDKDADRLRYGYTAVPTIFFMSGDAIIKKETGYRSKEQIKKVLVMDPGLAPAEWN